MGEKNFMVAGTEVEGYIDKIDQCLNKISNILGEACVTRAKKGTVSNSLEGDIDNIIRALPLDQQVIVLKKLAVVLCTQINGKDTTSSSKPSKSYSNDIFARRR